jgi:hypothetical protein
MLEHYTESDLATLQDLNAWTTMMPNPKVMKTQYCQTLITNWPEDPSDWAEKWDENQNPD